VPIESRGLIRLRVQFYLSDECIHPKRAFEGEEGEGEVEWKREEKWEGNTISSGIPT
jgi:hypothetical protein